MENKVISIKDYQKNKLKDNKMLLIIILFSIIIGTLIWNKYVEQQAYLDIEIPESNNIFYNNQDAIASTTANIAAVLEENEGKPVLFYLYTTWCGVCKKNFAAFNEVAREFQNTDLKVVAVAIDKDMDGDKLMKYLDSNGNFYFEPRFLAFREGFNELLGQRGIKYRGVIPFTALIGGDGVVRMSYNGSKKTSGLRLNIIKELYPQG